MCRGVELVARSRDIRVSTGHLKIALAEAEAQCGDPERALAILDEALATSDRTGHAHSRLNCIASAAKSC